MFNYSKLSYQLKREIKRFTNKISKGLSRPKYKLVFQMLYGMLESQSTHLSNISRALKEDITLKKTIDRLSRNLGRFVENDTIIENYMDIVKENTNNLSVLIVDNSDISKPYSEMLDSLCEVRDSSTGEITTGYHLLEITALTKEHKMPMPVYTRVYSSTENGFISEDEEVLNGLKHLTKHFGKTGIRTMDRGYDANVYYKYFLRNNEKFIIRFPVIITKVYLMRWRIEEYYRFKKQQFGFEDFRVQSLNSIRTLNTLLTVLIGLLSTFSEKQNDSIMVMEIIECSKRIYGKSKFIYYALGDGIFNILKKTRKGITSFLVPKNSPPSQQLDIFKTFSINADNYYAY